MDVDGLKLAHDTIHDACLSLSLSRFVALSTPRCLFGSSRTVYGMSVWISRSPDLPISSFFHLSIRSFASSLLRPSIHPTNVEQQQHRSGTRNGETKTTSHLSRTVFLLLHMLYLRMFACSQVSIHELLRRVRVVLETPPSRVTLDNYAAADASRKRHMDAWITRLLRARPA